ncbi:MAG: abhydrolase domain-containing 18 [Acidimicrobiia bacterium]|nr:abhydrolase domain-containing 18 [Acidimicrobiia bacterium]
MLGLFFHAWERRLAAVTKDRIVRPFEWGLDWVSPDGHRAPPHQHLRAWADDCVRDSDAFFGAPPTNDYRFDPAPPEVRRQGEAGTVRFPSALATPHERNNTVSARWFPVATPDGDPRDRRLPAAGAASDPGGRAVVVLPQWNSDAEGHVGLCRLFARTGISALRLTLPYHDERMPPELTRADYIVSSNIARTVQVCRQAVMDARRAVAWLALQGFTRIGIVGTSLGSCLSLLTAAHEPRIRAQALNHVSPWFADVVWRGLSTRHVREGLDGHIDLDTLRDLWRPISPWTYLDRVRDTRTLLVYARYDLTFPVDLSRTLVEEFRRRNLPHEVRLLPCGHYSTGVAPFKYYDGYLLVQFLRRNL